MTKLPPKPPFDWKKFGFLLFIHVGAIVGVVLSCFEVPAVAWSWKSVLVASVWFYFSSIGITAGYHRLFSHRAYEAHPVIQFLYLIWASAAFQGSARYWSAIHRLHHNHSDQIGDPHNTQYGFSHAHDGWTVRKTKPDFTLVPDLTGNKLVMWQDRFDIPLSMLTNFVLPGVIGYFWGEFLGVLIATGFIRLMIQLHMTFSVNSIAHFWGERISNNSQARDSWLMCVIGFGEGRHGTHHKKPWCWKNALHWWDPDPAAWFIWVCSKLGLTWNLRS